VIDLITACSAALTVPNICTNAACDTNNKFAVAVVDLGRNAGVFCQNIWSNRIYTNLSAHW
jgi:hypothetical protein